MPADKVREGQSPSPPSSTPPRPPAPPEASACRAFQARTSPRLPGRVTARPGEGLNINEPPRASRPALPRRACRARASSSDPVGLLQTPVGPTQLIAPTSTRLPAAPSLRSPRGAARRGLTSPVRPGSSAAQRKRRSECLQGRKHARPRAWVEESRLGERLRAARLDPLPTLPGTRRRRPARSSPLSPTLRGPGAGGDWGREASLGSAPRGRKPQISHRSARRSRVRPGTGRAGVGPARPDSGGPPTPPPRALGAPGWALGDPHRRDPLVGSRAGQKLCQRSLANRKFLIDKVPPLPHAGFKTKQKPSAGRQRAQPGPPPPRRPPRLGPRAPGAANRQAWRAGPARAPPRAPGCPPPGPGGGGGADRGRVRAPRAMSPRSGWASGGRQARSAAPGGRVGGGRGGRAAPPTWRIPLRGRGRAASSAWQSSRGNSMFRNSSGVAGGGGGRTRRAQPAPSCHFPAGGSAPPPPSPVGSQEGGEGRPPACSLLCPSLSSTH